MTSCTETKTSKEGMKITVVDPWLSPPPIYIDPAEAQRTRPRRDIDQRVACARA